VFQGRLTIGATQSPAANQALRLESSSGSGWQTVARSLADSGGSVTFTLKPTRSTKYRLAYAGVMTLSPSVSSVLAVIVKPHIVSAPKSSGSAHVAASVAVIGSHGNAGSAKAVAFLAAAEKQTGKKYVYGAAGPNAFDCSGLVMYVAAQFGLALPHHADSQLDYGKPVSAADAAPGDLIFFLDGGYAYHVGIYAGGHMMLDAPNSSTPVGLHTIWSSNVVFRRIF
jgi:cell wall-associated NlpC family hydrolase